MCNQNQIPGFISEIKSFLSERFHVTRNGLFDSYAKEEQSENSDIDLLV